MATRVHRSLQGAWLRWPTVLLCCVLSLTAPRDLTSLAQWLDGSLWMPAAAPIFVEDEEPIDDEEYLLRCGCPGDSLRLDRKHAQPQSLLVFDTFETPAWVHLHHPTPPLLACRPGCEHAFRNGCGSYLRC
jgi:hypothetical protein